MKKGNSRFLAYPMVVLFTGLLLAAFVAPSDKVVKDWEVPAKYIEIPQANRI